MLFLREGVIKTNNGDHTYGILYFDEEGNFDERVSWKDIKLDDTGGTSRMGPPSPPAGTPSK